MNSDKSVTEQDITVILRKLDNLKMTRGILVSNTKLVGSGEKIIKYVNSASRIFIQFFTLKDLLINITHHELVPKHIKCTQKEKEVVMKKYRVKEGQLPKILMSDPMARYLGLKKGDLVKIVRKSETAGLYVVYRIVI
jgi:DNA-directed RNA polymerase I, II, and III subunit RPABC1